MKNVQKSDICLMACVNTLAWVEEDMERLEDPKVLQESAGKAFYYGVMHFATREQPVEISKEVFDVEIIALFAIKGFAARLTPKQFMQMFPVGKYYKGIWSGVKDYFTTMKMIETFPMEEEIGTDNIAKFLWEYQNDYINAFVFQLVRYMELYEKLEGRQIKTEAFSKGTAAKLNTMYKELNEVRRVKYKELNEVREAQ